MNIRLISVGKLKERYLQQGIEEYTKRLSAYCRLEIIEVKDQKAPEALSDAEVSAVMQREAEGIIRHLREDAVLIALAIHGQEVSSEAFAQKISDFGVSGRSRLDFVIGGSLGLDQHLLARADERLSFSQMTFPHQLMRLIFCEQLYRAFRIIHNQPYHK